MTGKQVVCSSAGRGYRFHVRIGAQTLPAFVIRNDGQARAFLNQCAHQMVELDWKEGDFFDADGRYLVCATHGALYEPDTGACVYGRCSGRGLTSLEVSEIDNEVLLHTENDIHLTTKPER